MALAWLGVWGFMLALDAALLSAVGVDGLRLYALAAGGGALQALGAVAYTAAFLDCRGPDVGRLSWCGQTRIRRGS